MDQITAIEGAQQDVREKTPVAGAHLAWIEKLKGLALLWILLDHVGEQTFGFPYFANPDKNWPLLAVRVSQFLAVDLPQHPFSVPIAVIRDFCWMGDQGVSLFLLLSGFTLTYSILQRSRGGAVSWSEFYRRRVLRIYPTWITAHLLFLFPLAIVGIRLSLADSRLYLSLLGWRVEPRQLYYGFAAWWFITLLIQLYLVFPALWKVLERRGPAFFGASILAPALLLRWAGLLYFSDHFPGYLDAWSRGAIFVSRLPEFAAGMIVAYCLYARRHSPGIRRRGLVVAGSTAAIGIGLIFSFGLSGMAVAPLLVGSGVFGILYGWFLRPSSGPEGAVSVALDWIGRHSLALFLVHPLFLRAFFGLQTAQKGAMGMGVRLFLFAAGSVAGAIVLERVTTLLLRLIARESAIWGTRRFVLRVASAGFALWIALIAAELWVRRAVPQEAPDIGWGERASLEPDPSLGWKLRPSRQTHLRWVTYDYWVTANSLGFPGPLYAPAKDHTRRILVVGDAFTSAEGVDTDQSWPRLLEAKLRARSGAPTAEVLNFAVTGYGPNQYAEAVRQFAPRYQPDLILVGLFINDYEDAITPNAEFQKSIGFDNPDPNGLAAVLSFRQLNALLRARIMRVIDQKIRHRPDPDGYALGQFAQLVPGRNGNVALGRQAVFNRLQQIKQISDGLGARTIVILIPSGPQACNSAALKYWPASIDLASPAFDRDLPQRTTKEIDHQLNIETVDLLPVLRASPTCLYQTNNMHWTAAGHQSVAAYLATTYADKLLGSE